MRGYKRKSKKTHPEWAKTEYAKSRDMLKTRYVKRLFVAHSNVLGSSDIPSDLIEAKRAEVKLRRFLHDQN